MPRKTQPKKLLTQSSVRSLAAFARVELLMGREEFDQLSPSDWLLLFTQWKRKQLREDIRMARICQTIAATRGVTTALRDYLPDPNSLPKLRLNRKKKFKQTPASKVERQFLALFPKSANLKPQWPPTQ